MAKDFSFTKTFEFKYDAVIKNILVNFNCDRMCADDEEEDCTGCIHEVLDELFFETNSDNFADVNKAFHNWLNENMDDLLKALKKKLKENE